VVTLLLPLFFAFTGLRTDVGLIGADPKLWLATGLVLFVAIAGKWGGSSLAAKVMGLGWRESMAVGVLMNTRGLTELIILNIGLDLKVIPPTLFAILVIMALVTTFMTTPLLSVFYPPRIIEQMVQDAGGKDDVEGPQPYRVLIPVSNTSAASGLVLTALQLVREREEKAQIVLLRTVQTPGGAYRAGPRQYEAMLSRAGESLRPLVQLIEGAGHDAVPLVVPTGDIRTTIVDVTKKREPDLVLLGYARSLWSDRLLSGPVGEVLRDATTDVAVVIDPGGRGTSLPRGARVLVPYGGGYHEDVGLDLALRLAEASAGSVTLFGPADGEKEARELGDRAARAYEETGVWTVPMATTGEPGAALVQQLEAADLVVLGVGDEWVRNKQSLGGLRASIAARASVPLLIVRRHGQKGRLRRQREWIVDTGEVEAITTKGDIMRGVDPIAQDLT
jgi:nucleotide-binding universal stress UspA family protein